MDKNKTLMSSLSSSTLTASAGLLIAFSTACSAHADIPEVVVTQTDIVFDGVPRVEGITVPTALTTSFDHPDGFDLPEFLDPKLRPLGATVIAQDANQDLSFIESLTLTIGSRSPNAPQPATIASYTRTDTNAGDSLDITADPDADILAYWDTDTAFYQLSVNGSLPEDAWGVDVVVKFSGSLTVASQ